MSGLARYTTGYVASLACTFGAYFVVTERLTPMQLIVPIIVALAVVQLVVQMVCFLHMGEEERPRWKLVSFGFMAVTLLIVVFGSLWIMNNLNYHMQMPPDHTDRSTQLQHNKGF